MSNPMVNRHRARTRRHARIRSRMVGTAERPRLSVYRSNVAIYAQLIDDTKGRTIAAVTDRGQTGKTKVERAAIAGAEIATIAQKKGIKAVVFDRGGYRYQGRVAAVAQGARQAGLTL